MLTDLFFVKHLFYYRMDIVYLGKEMLTENGSDKEMFQMQNVQV